RRKPTATYQLLGNPHPSRWPSASDQLSTRALPRSETRNADGERTPSAHSWSWLPSFQAHLLGSCCRWVQSKLQHQELSWTHTGRTRQKSKRLRWKFWSQKLLHQSHKSSVHQFHQSHKSSVHQWLWLCLTRSRLGWAQKFLSTLQSILPGHFLLVPLSLSKECRRVPFFRLGGPMVKPGGHFGRMRSQTI